MLPGQRGWVAGHHGSRQQYVGMNGLKPMIFLKKWADEHPLIEIYRLYPMSQALKQKVDDEAPKTQ